MGVLARKMMVAAAAGIQYVGGNTAAKVGATTGDSTIALNSGLTGGIASSVSTDDLVIAVFATGTNSDLTLAITDGTNNYTLIDSEMYVNSSYDLSLRVAYKFMGGTPDTATTFGPTGSDADAGAMAVYIFRGVDKTTPLDVTSTTATSTGFGALPNPPSITPVTPGAFIVCIGAHGSSAGVQSYSSSDLTAFLTIGENDANDVTLGIGQKDDWSSGAFDAAVFTFSGSTAFNQAAGAFSIALRPA
jgi:hypothetical protein